MTNEALTEYLAKMENMTVEQFLKDRNGTPKAIDNLRIFYVAQYEAKQEAVKV